MIPTPVYTHVYTDMCIDMWIDTCVEMWIDMSTSHGTEHLEVRKQQVVDEALVVAVDRNDVVNPLVEILE